MRGFHRILQRAGTLGALLCVLGSCSHRADQDPDLARPGPSAAPEPPLGACGRPGERDCPLQAWMKANMSPAMSAADVDRLKRAFVRAGELGPGEFASWRVIAGEGARAASEGDVEGARRACKRCHDEHRARYRTEMRGRGLP